MQAISGETRASDRPAGVHVRLWWLVGGHAVLATAPVIVAFCGSDLRFPADIQGDFLRAVVYGLATAPAMLLAFWCAVGTNGAGTRAAGCLGGVLYLTATHAAWAFMPEPIGLALARWDGVRFVAVELASLAVFVGLLAGVLLIVRRWIAQLRYVERPDDGSTSSVRFSIRHLLAITLAAALILALARASLSEWHPYGIDWQGWAQAATLDAVLIVNTLAAAWAALTLGGVRVRLLIASLAAFAAGAAYAVPVSTVESTIWLLALASLLSTLIPTFLLLASLLVVRSCGYRLVAVC